MVEDRNRLVPDAAGWWRQLQALLDVPFPTLEEAERELRADGLDPDDVGRRLRERLAAALPRDTDLQEQLAAVVAERDRLAADLECVWGRAINIARGCTDYMGGYSGRELEAYHHGMHTVERVLRATMGGDTSLQVRVVEAIGAADAARETS